MGSQEVLRMLKGRWLAIVLAGLIGTAIALGVAAVLTPRYTAQSVVFVTVTSGQSTGDLAQGSTFSQDQARNFAAVVPMEKVLGPVIAELGLNTSLQDLRKDIDVDVPLNTSLITIKATDNDPEMAARIANSVAKYLEKAVTDLSPKVDGTAPVSADLIEEASVPIKPSSPIIPLFAVLGLLGGLVLIIGYLVVVELVVARVGTTDQVEALTGSTVLASVPKDRTISRHPVAVTARPLSLRAENIRQMRTAMKFLPGDGNRTFVMTSSVSGEGKSTTAANIAAAFAAEGLSTCLVEADLRRPRLETVLDLTGGAGLSDVIVGQSQIEDTLQAWGPDNLQVILAGTIPPNASELLGSARGHEALQTIAGMFDVTIIDTPPLTAVTDAAIIGRLFDGVILVVGAGKARTSELRQAIAALSVADVPVRGTVLNLTKGDSSRPYAYSYADKSRDKSWFTTNLPQTWRPLLKGALTILAAALVAVMAVVLANRPSTAGALAGTTPGTTTSAISAAPVATQSRVVFLGDSLVAGVGGNGTAWPDLVSDAQGWNGINLGRGGTGYLTTSNSAGCGLTYCPSVPEMAVEAVSLAPDIVVICAGQNDVKQDVTTAAKNTFAYLHKALPKAKIIVILPSIGYASESADMDAIRAEVSNAASHAPVTLVDIGNPLAGHKEWFNSDRVHPNAAGYRELAADITTALKKI